MTYDDQDRVDLLSGARTLGQLAAALRSAANLARNPSQKARETLAEGLQKIAGHVDEVARRLAAAADGAPGEGGT